MNHTASRFASGVTINEMTCPTLRDIFGIRTRGGIRMIRNAPKDAPVFGVDLGKNLFHIGGPDERGCVPAR